MFRLLTAAAFLFAAIAGSPDQASAQRGKWELLASKKVNMLADRDVIEMSRSDGRFTALRFESKRGTINIYRVRVHFGNGEHQDLEVNQKIREGERTKAIDLDGRRRFIDRIEMLYASSKLFERASIDIFGRQGGKRIADNTGDDEPRVRPVSSKSLKGWTKLGQRNADFDFDRDRIWVGLDKGRFDAIVLRAKGGDIRLRDLKVVYGNGKVDDIRVRKMLRDGSKTRALDLEGRHRGIRRIEVTYRKASNRRRPVLLEAYGRPARRAAVVEDTETAPAPSADGWQVLGSRDVDLTLDRDAITIDRGEGPFDAIALRSRGSAVNVYDIRVTFGNGKRQTIRVDQKLRRGRQSDPIDLKGRKRRITKVELLYEKSRKNRRRATIEVLGRSAANKSNVEDDTDDRADAAPLPRGWSLVGREEIKRRASGGTISPDRRARYREVMFRVSGAPVTFRSALITFRNGSTMRLRMPSTLRNGDRTKPIDLKGRRRIERIELDTERNRSRRTAVVEIIGRD